MAASFLKSFRATVAVVSVALTAAFSPAGARAQTQGAAVPVPFVTGLAGFGSSTLTGVCAAGILNTDNVNYGDGCPSTQGRLSSPQGAAVDKYGNVYVSDYSDRAVRVVYNGGTALAAAITAANSGYTISTTTSTRPAPAPTPVVGNIYTLAGFGATTMVLTNTATDGKFVCANYAASGQPEALNSLGDGCPAASAPVAPRDVTVDVDGNVFITDYGNARIRVFCVNCAASTLASQLITLENPGVAPVNGAMYTIVGFADGYRDAAIGFGSAAAATASVALLRAPTAAAVSSSDDVFIADNTNNAVRVLYNGGTAARNILTAQGITPQQGYVYTIAGAGCVSAAVGKTGSVTSANSCLTTTGSDTATLGNALGLKVAWTVYLDPNGNVYYSDAGNARVKVIYGGIAAPLTLPNAANPTLQAGYSYSFAGQGTGTAGAANGVAPSAIVLSATSGAQGVGGDSNGNIFFEDYVLGYIYEVYAQTGITAITGGNTPIATGAANAYCNGGTTGPQMTDAYYNGCPATQAKFASPRGPVVADNQGNLYYGDSVGYFLRKFSYNPTFPATAVAATSAAQPYAFTFLSAQTLTAPTVTSRGASGSEFANAGTGTCTTGLAATTSSTCTVNLTFTPQRPGLVTGAVQLRGTAGVLADSLFSGTGTGAALNVDPGTVTTAGSGTQPNGIAVDGAGNVFVTDLTSKSLIRYTGGVSFVVGTPFTAPSGVAVDGAGNIFVADSTANTITEIPILGATRFTVATGLNGPRNLAVDGVGNLYVADTGNNRILQYGPGATTPTVVGFIGLTAPQGVAVDAAGNIYASDSTHIVKLTPAFVQTTVATTSASTGLAVDAGGNVYTLTGTSLTEYPASGGAGFSIGTFVTPKSLAIDGSGNLYVADNGAPGYATVRRTAAAYTFPTSPASTTIYLTNSGNASLTQPSYTQTNTVDFSLTPATTNGCSGPLAAGTTCALTASFNPTTSGTRTNTVNFSSNATNGTPITLTLTGTIAAQTTTTALTASPATLVYGNVETLTATVTGATTNPTNGTVNFYNNTTTLLGTGNVGAGGVATFAYVPGVGSYSVTAVFVPNGLTYSASTSAAKTFTVTPATLTVTANNASKVFGAANPAFTYSITGFVNNDTQASATTGTPTETTTATTTSPAGSYPITITQGSLAATNYTFTFVNGTLAITGGTAQTITFGALPSGTYGAAPITLTATASSNLPVSYTVTGPATISGSTLTITGAGTVSVTATQVGNNTYAAATPVTQSFTVAKAALTVTATSATRVYGSANPTLAYTIAGFVNNDTQVTATTGAPAESTTATASSGVGSYPIIITAGTLAAANYSFTFVNGAITVTPATLTLTANNATKVYGTANPTFGGTLTGAVNNDVLTETFTTSATTTSNAGTYAIVPGATGANIANYTIAPTNGTLTITQAKPTVTIATSATNGFSGSTSITLTATLTSPTSGAPTGTVTFLSGTTVVGTGPISGNTATLTLTSLPVGADSITAVYGGDTNFSASTSSAVTVTIAAGFSATSSSTALSFQPGYQEAQAFLTINPGGRTDTLTFACQGLPAKLSCTFTPATLALSGLTTAQTVQLLVSNSSAKASLEGAPAPHGFGSRAISLAGLAGLPVAALLLLSLRRRRLPMLFAFALLTLGAAAGLSGCGTAPSDLQQSSGAYPFTVTVNSGSTVLQTINYTLTIP